MQYFLIPILFVILLIVPLSAFGLFYEIDTKCELSYFIQRTKNDRQSMFSENFIEKLRDESIIVTQEYTQKIKDEPWRTEEFGNELSTWLRDRTVDEIMNHNSIDPKLRPWIVMLEDFGQNPEINRQGLTQLIVLDPQYYQEDLTCGKKLHEDFGNDIYLDTKRLHGEDFASQQQEEIKRILYESPVIDSSNGMNFFNNLFEQIKILFGWL